MISKIENQVQLLVLGFFSKINADVVEKNGLFDVTIPENYFKLFKDDSLKITFNPQLSNKTDYELILPGSNLLLKILNKCIDYGPIVLANLSPNTSNLKIIRFYFYVIFESIKTKTELLHIDVEIDSKNIVEINDTKIDFNQDSLNFQVDSESIDDCYVESITYLEQKLMKSKINDFKTQIFNLKEEELQNIISEYKIRNKEIQEKYTKLRSKGVSEKSLDNLMDENKIVHDEEIRIRANLDKKYSIVIDIALIASLIL